MLQNKNALLLYTVTDRRWLNGGSLKDQVEKAIKGGATFIQLREKDLDRASLKAEALEIQALCRAYHIPFVLDDDVELAVEINADGVHVGQKDLEASCARQKLGPDRILGVSAQTVAEAIAAEKAGADYLGVGAVFPTSSKNDADDVSHETLQDICRSVSIPVIAIGGITRDNVNELSGTGIVGIAVISAIFAKEDITAATADLKEQTLKALEQSK